MPKFRGSDFQIEIPHQCSDESTYAFAFPARENFRPSVVVKTERLAEPVALGAYAEKQLATLKPMLPGFSVVASQAKPAASLPSHEATFDWVQNGRRVRQRQRYVALEAPARIVSITGSALAESFAEVEALFDAVMDSFVPVSGEASV